MVIRHHNAAMALADKHQHHIYVGRIIHSKSLSELKIIPNGAIGVAPNGTISFVCESNISPRTLRNQYTDQGFSDARVTTLPRHQFLFPGLIDTHLHASQWPNIALGMDSTLKDWIEEFTDPMEASFNDIEKARRVYQDVVTATLRLGSTMVAYCTTMHVHASNVLAECVVNAGQRAVVGKMCVTTGSTKGNWEDSTQESLKGSEECIRFVKGIDPEGRLVRSCVQPRGGPYCPSDSMEGLGEQVARYEGCYVQAHMCETESDIERTLKLHPNFTCYSDMYRAYGLLTNRTILAHCIHLQPKDIQNIVETNAGIAHNPNSNTSLRDGICRVRDQLDAGIKVGLGTDCSAGYMPSIHSAMRSASDVSRHLAMQTEEERYVLKFEEVVYLATMGGARVLDMQDQVGSFEVGKWFDALVVDVRDVVSVDRSLWEKDEEGNGEALVRKWVFCGDDMSIRKVFVGGKMVAGHDINVEGNRDTEK